MGVTGVPGADGMSMLIELAACVGVLGGPAAAAAAAMACAEGGCAYAACPDAESLMTRRLTMGATPSGRSCAVMLTACGARVAALVRPWPLVALDRDASLSSLGLGLLQLRIDLLHCWRTSQHTRRH
jgi:hypothetical protein